MKIAFLGDFVLDGKKLDTKYFSEIHKYFEENGIVSCVNLESPFVTEGMQRAKEKVTLKASTDRISELKYVNPFLINLSNNHINDFGNESCELTKEILSTNNYTFFGVGYANEINSNLHIDDENKVIYIAYVTRSSDFTGSKLFAETDFIGGFDFNAKQLQQLKIDYPDYTLIVNIHWGIENIVYPEVEKTELARKIIDEGADIIIGHHPHIIQPMEVYKGKYIFYSLGNFYFPQIEFELKGEVKTLEVLPHQKKGIIPLLDVKNGELELKDILLVENTDNKQLVSENYKLKQIDTNNSYYSVKYKAYRIYARIFKLLQVNIRLLFTDPLELLHKIKRKLKLN